MFGAHHIEWWQALIALYFLFTTIDRVAAIAEHLGLVPVRLLTWLQHRWLRTLEERARRQALDALLSNGITSKLDALRVEVAANAELLAGHLEEAAEDRRLAAGDRLRLNKLYEHLLNTPEGKV